MAMCLGVYLRRSVFRTHLSHRVVARHFSGRLKLEEIPDPPQLSAEEEQKELDEFNAAYKIYQRDNEEQKVEVKKDIRRVGVIAQKIGMIDIYDNYGERHPASILRIEDCDVVQVKTRPNSVGLVGLQVGAGTKKDKNATKALRNHCAAAGVPPKRRLIEFTVSPEAVVPAGTPLNAMHFNVGQFVDVRGVTKGKGFAGVMKRHGFSGMPASHGVSKSHRQMGSTGGCQDPGKVWKGKKMPGRMGGKNRTVQNMRILRIDPVRSLVYVRGSIPGAQGGWLTVRDAIKKPKQVDELPCPTHTASPNDPTSDMFATSTAANPFMPT